MRIFRGQFCRYADRSKITTVGFLDGREYAAPDSGMAKTINIWGQAVKDQKVKGTQSPLTYFSDNN